MAVTTTDAGATLRPYLPRLELQWLTEDPEALVREIDGTLVFVDISGFTKMSERLARHGKVGAEEVTDVLGAVFARLLAVAYANGGGLIKFGGDALLLWFSGAEHQVRGARAAHGMRAMLRSVGKIDTTAGQVTLRMSIGVNSGRYHFFLVGGSHRELVVAGPATTGTVQMEGTASAGEILLGPATFEHLPEKVVGAVKGAGRLLRSEPPGLSADATEPDISIGGLDLLPYIPLGLRESILAGTEPEHRSATIAFVHFDGTDSLIQEEGPEAAAAALDELVRDVQEAVDDVGVCFLSSDADADGGKLILTAGVPRALGDDEERMLLALRRIVAADRRIPIRIGTNRGAIFSGDVGPPYRRTYTVMGDPVNLAARLMAKAPRGEVYAMGEVLDRSATRFDLVELEPFMVKGKARPVHAWSVGAAIGSRVQDSDAQRLPLVGREEEMVTLVEALDRAREGRGRLVELAGEPGIGKTRLVEELRERAVDLRVIRATAEAYTSSTPYVLWRELLRAVIDLGWDDPDNVVIERVRGLVSEKDPDLLPWLPLIALALGAEAPPTPEVELLGEDFRRPKLHEAVLAFLTSALPEATVIEIEDAHFMDGASADLLASIIGTLSQRPWLIVVTRRDTEAGFVAPEADAVLTLRPGPLATDDALALAIAASEDAPLLPHDLQTVAERSGGSPQFLLDLVRVVASGSMLPESVETAAMARIDHLPSADRSLVRRASILGMSFHPRLLDDVLDKEMLRPDERTWARLGEFFEDDGDGYVRFRRAVVRDAAYTGLPFRTRRALHSKVGERLEREAEDVDEAAGILSLHFFLAGDNARAWRYARTAGARAAAQFANQEAAQLYRRAVDAARRLPDVPDIEIGAVHEAMGHCYDLSGAFDRAIGAYAAARRLCSSDPLAEARILYERSVMEERSGRYSRALGWVTRARKRLDGVSGDDASRQRARIDALHATVLQSAGRLNDSVRWCRRAIEEGERADEPRALAQAYFVLGWVDITVGRPSAPNLSQALRIYEELGDFVGQAQLSMALGGGLFFEGQWDQAQQMYERSRDLYLKVGDPVSAIIDDLNIAEVLTEQGRLAEAEPLLRNCVRTQRAAGDLYSLGTSLIRLAYAASRAGRCHEALQILEEARSTLLLVGAQAEALETDAVAAECYAFLLDGKAALSMAEEALSSVAALGGASVVTPLLERVRGYALAQLGRPDEAEAAFSASLKDARERGADFQIALTLLAIGRLARLRGETPAADQEEESAAILTRLGVIAVAAPAITP